MRTYLITLAILLMLSACGAEASKSANTGIASTPEPAPEANTATATTDNETSSAPASTSNPAPKAAEASVDDTPTVSTYTGLFIYMADAAVFTPCGGKMIPVESSSPGYANCEKTYMGMEKMGEPALMTVEGYLVDNPNPEGKKELLRITKLLASSNEKACP